jgi:hypothetical protein
MSRAARWAIAGALGALAFAFVLQITEPLAPGLDPDAISYLGSGQSFARAGSLMVENTDWESPDSVTALSHFPPGFPIALALPIRLGMAPVQAARLVEAFAAFVTVSALALLLLEAELPAGALLLAGMLTVTPALVAVHQAVLSEPLFLAFLALDLAAVSRARDRPLLGGLAAAAALMVRYAGISCVAATALWSFAASGSWKQRVRRGFAAGAPGALAMGLWLLHTSRAAGPGSVRSIGVYGGLGQTLREGFSTVVDWLVPLPDDGWWRVIAAVLAGTAALGISCLPWWRSRRPETQSIRGDSKAISQAKLIGAATVLACCYLGTVVLARWVADPGIPLDFRLLAPFFLLASVCIATAVTAQWRTLRLPARVLAVLLLGGWGASSVAATKEQVRFGREEGIDYMAREWRNAEIIQWARAHAAGHQLFTNSPAALYFHADRLSKLIPDATDPDDARAFADTVRRRGGIVIAFNRVSEFVSPVDSLLRALGASELAVTRDGSAWSFPARSHTSDMP